MKFECGDLERALAVPELMMEARAHMKECAACRREYRLWLEISEHASALHQEWDSATLWPRIRQALAAEPRPRPAWWADWRTWACAAAILLASLLLIGPRWERPPVTRSANRPPAVAVRVSDAGARTQPATDHEFLTEEALREAEKNEAAYLDSIAKLRALAEPRLTNPDSARAVNDHEKILLLDSAISDVRGTLDGNRFNAQLQTELASLYREKRQTLEDVLAHDRTN